MSTDQRAEAEQAKQQLELALAVPQDDATDRTRFGIISNLLLSKPIAGASAEVGRARGQAYREALDDVPPWAIAAVVRKWRRGEYGDSYDYTWAPHEALLRKLALAELVPLRETLNHVVALLSTRPLDEIMQETAGARDPRVVEGFRKLSVYLHTGRDETAQERAAAE